MVNEFKLAVVHFARPNPMQTFACAWINRWTKNCRKSGPLGRWAAGPLGRWAAGPLGRWAAGPLGLFLVKPWSNASTFARFHNKPIEHSPDANFGQAVLSSV